MSWSNVSRFPTMPFTAMSNRSASVILRLLNRYALLVQIAEQVERFDADVSAVQAAF